MVDIEPYSENLLWIVIIGFLIAFVLAFGIGANDVANSFGTSVGSKVLTLRQACILATIFEILGSILIGAKVSDTIRKGIIDPALFTNPKELMLGQVASLLSCCIWLLVATFFNLPVSGTHSIVGATVGFALVAQGSRGIQWIEFAKIAGSWFVSPALAGIISIAVFFVIRKFILSKNDQLTVGLRWLPFFYAITIMINVFSILLSAPPLLYFDRIPLWGKFVTTILVGIIVAIFVMVVVKPRMRENIEAVLKKKRDWESLSEQPQLRKTEGRFETYTVSQVEIGHTSNKEIQVDCLSMRNELNLLRYQEKNPEQFCPFVEMQRIRKDSEPSSNAGHTKVSRKRRDSDRRRSENPSMDGANTNEQRSTPATPTTREKTKIYRFPPNTNPASLPGAISNENKGLLLSADEDNLSVTSVNQHTSNEDLDDVDDKMPEISEKKKMVDTDNDSTEVAGIFKYLQILTAIFGAFAHGGNDVSNAIGPLIGIWLIYIDGSVTAKSSTPLWVLFYGGLGISVGLWVWGRRVIRTIGEDLTKITPSSGFVIEVSTAFTVLFASNLSIPISTTHCKVGSVVAIGRFRSKQSVDWSLFRNIIAAWVVTVPVTGGIAAEEDDRVSGYRGFRFFVFRRKSISPEMAHNKEALALVVDVGMNMSEAAPGYDSALQMASDILQMIVQRKMFQESKDELALILYGAEETNNDLADEDNYRNINVVFPLSAANWHLFEEIQKVKSGTNPADLVDAVVVAADHLRRETEGKHGFAAKRVMLFTNAATTFSDHSLKTILDSLRRQDIIVDAIGPTWGQEDEDEESEDGSSQQTDGHDNSDADHPSTNGHNRRQTPRKPLTQQQQTGIRVIGQIVNTTEGTLFTFREAMTILSVHQSKLVKPTATKYILQLADMKLHICTYIQVKDNKPAIFRLKKVYARDPTTEIKVDRGRYTKDEQDQEIEKEELTDGFRYGTTFVPINKETLDEMKYQSEKCFSIIAFSDANMVRRSHYLGDTVYEVVSEAGFEEEAQAFAGLVQAMYDTNTVAIIRRCFSERSAPEIGFLRPHIEHDHICMYYVKLPFAEDLREFEFDNIDMNKRNQPSDEQFKLIDNLITTMDLTHADRGGEEAFRPELVFNPYTQRMFQSIARRAVTPDEPLALSNTVMEMNESVLRSISSRSKRVLDMVHEKFSLRDMERRQKVTTGDALFGNVDSSTKKVRLDENENIEEPTVVGDTGSFESQIAAKKKAALRTVGTLTPVEDFKLLIEQGSPSLVEVCKQMSTLILELVNNSHGDALFEKALQCLQCLRETCIDKLEPKLFNDVEVLLKRQASTVDGRRDFWQKIIDEKLSLITTEECVESNVIPVEAMKFLEDETPMEALNSAAVSNEQEGDEEDLFDLI